MKSKYFPVKFLLSVFILSAFISCKKLPNGFLSPTVRYEQIPIIVSRGRTLVSAGLNFDGSSIPASIKLLHVYDSAGNNVDNIFFKQYTIKGWTALYDPATDTTLAQIAAKQTDMQITPIIINSSSGQVEANYTTLFVPSGLYSFDLQISNGAGTRVYPKIGQMQFLDPIFADNAGDAGYEKMYKVGNESISGFAGTPEIDIQHISDTPNVVILKIVDKNGVPWNPAAGEIIPRPYPGLNPPQPYLQTLSDYALTTTKYSDRMEFTYGTLPFPLISKGNGFSIYYRIPTQYFSADNQDQFPGGEWSLNPRFGLRVYVQGKYDVIVKLNDMTHR
ncbi:MAG: hypothetical protein ACR2FN_04300 [Chitinophagaceae bacterium]